MEIIVSANKLALGQKAAARGATLIRQALKTRGFANIMVATGASQFEMLEQLVKEGDIHWPAVTCFHLDEYVGIPITHAGSFRKYLWERFVSRLPLPLAAFHYVNGEGDPQAECKRLSAIIRRSPIDVAFVGIGENGHLAFNDPPADFETREPYLVVNLDDACRQQQMGEGWFPVIGDVPRQAISMSCHQIMQSKAIIVSVPDARKAVAVKRSIEGPVTPAVPASILQKHENVAIYLDGPAASMLTR
jgi:glucosamine-6-phosphate deaminase